MKKFLCSVVFLIIYGLSFSQQIWFEGFETATFPPSGWNIINIAGTKTWELYTDYPHSGTKAARHDFDYGLHATALVTSPITLPNYGIPTLEFWSYMQLYGYEYGGVLVSTTSNNDINAFTEIKVLAGDEIILGDWIKINVPLDAYIGQTVYIAFLYSGTYANRWTLDDIAITHFASFVDMQATGITPKTGEYAYLPTNQQITVNLKNNGGAAASGFSLKLFQNDNLMATETFTGSIPSLGTAEYTFNATLNLSPTGTHTIKAVAEITGDQVPANNTATSTLTHLGCSLVTDFPFFEGFENNGGNLPPCWTQEYVAYPLNWQVLPNSTHTVNPDESFEGTYRAVFSGIGYDHVTKLITPPLNLTALGNPALKFHHVQRRDSYTLDSLKVYYKTAAQGEWKLLEKYTNEVFEWTERMISLPEPSGEYYIAFEGYYEFGNSVQIDNVIVGDFFDTDIEVKAITPVGTHLYLSSNQEITATIKNNGRSPVSGFNISLFRNGSWVATELFSDVIPGMDEVEYTFNATIDFSMSGRYAIKVLVELSGDEVAENDTLTVIVRNLICDALTFPHDEGMEEKVFPPYCWTTVGSGWKRVDYAAHSGISRAVHTWYEGSEGWLISPKFSLPANGNFMMEFWSSCYYSDYYSYSGVWVSTTNNNTASFIEVHELTPDEYPEDEWVKIEVPLNNYSGQNIYIAFKYRNFGGDSGHMWSIDDFNIYNLNSSIDAQLVAISAPPTLGVDLTDEELVTVQIKNNGNQSISNFPIQLKVDDTVITETYQGTIPSFYEGEYTFSQKFDFSNKQRIYKVTATVQVSGDENPDNNSKTKTVVNFSGEAAEIAGCQVFDDDRSTCTFVKFSTSNPGTITELHAYTDNMISAGAYSNGSLYFYTLNADSGIPEEFVQLKTHDFSLLANTPTTYEAADMTHDLITNTLYGIMHVSATQSRLVLVNPDNGNMTPIGNMGRYMFTLACNKLGELYGIDAAGNFCSVNKTTGAAEVIGSTGFIPYRFQSMTFNKEGRLFWAMYDHNLQGKLLEVHTSAGICYNYGALGNNAEIVMLYDPNAISSIKDLTGEKYSLFTWVEGDRLCVGGLNVGEPWRVYSIIGALVYQGVARNETASFKPNSHGFYIIQSGKKVVKAVY